VLEIEPRGQLRRRQHTAKGATTISGATQSKHPFRSRRLS